MHLSVSILCPYFGRKTISIHAPTSRTADVTKHLRYMRQNTSFSMNNACGSWRINDGQREQSVSCISAGDNKKPQLEKFLPLFVHGNNNFFFFTHIAICESRSSSSS